MLHWIEGGRLIKGGRLLSGGGVAYSREELVWYYSDFRRKDGGKKRTAKRMCVSNRVRVITCVFCRDLHFTLMFSVRLQNKIIVTLVTQRLVSSFLSLSVA